MPATAIVSQILSAAAQMLEAAEERKRLGVGAVAHHGGEDLVVRHAVLLAGDEVVHAVGGSGGTMPVPAVAST